MDLDAVAAQAISDKWSERVAAAQSIGRLGAEARELHLKLLNDDDLAVIEAMADALLASLSQYGVDVVAEAVYQSDDQRGDTLNWCVKEASQIDPDRIRRQLESTAGNARPDAALGAISALEWLGWADPATYLDISLSAWNRVINPDDGVLPNGRVENASSEDWQTTLELLVARGWSGLDEPVDASEIARQFETGEISVVKAVLPLGLQINFFPFNLEQIDFDLDLRDLTSQHRIDELTSFIRTLGNALRKVVLLSAEGADDFVFAHYDPRRQELWCGPQPERPNIIERLRCPCCGWAGLQAPPYERWPAAGGADAEPPYAAHFGGASFEICACCGFEFGYDDDGGASGSATSFGHYRTNWQRSGCTWFAPTDRPRHWDVNLQFRHAGIEIQ